MVTASLRNRCRYDLGLADYIVLHRGDPAIAVAIWQSRHSRTEYRSAHLHSPGMPPRGRSRTIVAHALVVLSLVAACIGLTGTSGTAATTTWRAVDTSGSSTCAVRNDGTLWCWGADISGSAETARRPAQVGSATTWAEVSVGTTLACGLRLDASLWCWGVLPGAGDTVTITKVPTQVPGAWRAVDVGGQTICAVRTAGELYCWGAGGEGQTGTGTPGNYPAPQRVAAASSWASVSVGSLSACATTTVSALWCWGWNGQGQLGDGTRTQRLVPVRVAETTTWQKVAAGNGSTCAISVPGDLWCWGDNYRGSLGTGSAAVRFVLTPARVGASGGWASVAKSSNAACGTRADGTVWCWGNVGAGSTGVLGDGADRNLAVPTQIASATGWTRVAIGTIACGIEAGNLHCWGTDSYGALGTGLDVGAAAPTPQTLSLSKTVLDVSAGRNTCAVTSDGALRCWGSNLYGSIGDGTDVPRTKPVRVGTDVDWAFSSSGGEGRTCAVKTSGSLWCWGYLVGDGTGDYHFSPVQILAGTTWSAVSVGARQTCGIQTNGSMWCWGSDNVATTRYTPTQIGTATSWVGVSTGADHVCGVRTNATLWCWGQNYYGQLGGGDGAPDRRSSPAKVAGTGWASVSSGAMHTCATKTDGTAWCWGSNGDGRLGQGLSATPANVTAPAQVGTGTSWTSIGAGTFHTCALATGGAVSCWGSQRHGALGIGRVDGTGFPQQVPGTWKALSTGISQTCAVDASTSKLACWGYGALGFAVATGGDPIT